MFDLIASEYGYTFEQFSAMTMRQISNAADNISKRIWANKQFDAKIHGAELKMPEVEQSKAKFTDEQNKTLDDLVEQSMKERFKSGNK